MLNSISLNLMLLGKAARGELVGMENIQERQIGWVQSMEDELARLNSSLDAWAEVLLNTDESKDEEPSKEPALKPTGGGSQSND